MRTLTKNKWWRVLRYAATRPAIELTLVQTRFRMLRQRLPEVNLQEMFPGIEALSLCPAIRDDAGLPPYTETIRNLEHDDFSPLASIVNFLKPTCILELGTSFGNLTANLCHMCPGARVITVNALPGEQTGVLTAHDISANDIGRVYRAHGFGHQVEQIFANTLTCDVSAALCGDKLDLAIIDACHDSHYVVSDFSKIQPHVRPGGVVMLHDTHPSLSGATYGSYIGCLNLMDLGYDVRYLSGTWWAVWKNSAKATEA